MAALASKKLSLDNRKLLSTTVLYGIADVIVMAVGGFLLLPLYTRTLSQAEFGTYVVVKANTEIFTYLVCLGLPSAVSRVYFDYRKVGQQASYITSILLFFVLGLAVLLTLLAVWGDRLWGLLSPGTPATPFLAFSVALAAAGFTSTLGTLWLRLEGRAKAFALAQVATAAMLSICAVVNLTWMDLGLPGLLWAMLISTAAAGLLLPWLLGRGFRPVFHWEHIRSSLPFAGPSLLGYLAYFLVNRIGTLVLQRHAPMDDIAVFGLSQQLALIVTMAAGAFGKAQQPAIFGAEPAEAAQILDRAGRLLRWMMLGVTSLLLLFSSELMALVAPKNYGNDIHILLILLIANFTYSLSQVSDTALLYHRRPRESVSVSIFGALLSTGLSLLLVPRYHAAGAAAAIAVTAVAMTLLSYGLAWRVTGHSYMATLLGSLAAATAIAVLAAWLPTLGWPAALTAVFKLSLFTALAGAFAWRHFRQ